MKKEKKKVVPACPECAGRMLVSWSKVFENPTQRIRSYSCEECGFPQQTIENFQDWTRSKTNQMREARA